MDIWFDLRFTLRLLARNFKFSLLAMFVIALGVGIALPVQNLTSNFFDKTLPFPEGERFVVFVGVDKSNPASPQGVRIADGLDNYIFKVVAERSRSYKHIGAAQKNLSSTISDGDSAEVFASTRITPGLLKLPGVKPVLGRILLPEDSYPEAKPVVLISHKVWQNYYAGQTDIVGHTSRVNGVPHSIIGVMPENFAFPVAHDVWLPLASIPDSQEPGEGALTPIALLKPNVSLEQADAELLSIMQRLAAEFPEHYGSLEAKVMPYTRIILPNDIPVFQLMSALSLVIYLLAALNVGNLLLVRAMERGQELVIRSALGGTRWRLVQQSLLESFVLCFGGGILGLGLAYAGVRFIDQEMPVKTPFWMQFELNADTILWAVLITLSIWVLAGGLAAWRASSLDPGAGLNSSGKGITGKASGKATAILVSVEVILSVFLLTASGVLVFTMNVLQKTDYGTETDGYLTASIDLSLDRHGTSLARNQYYEGLQARLGQESGILSAALTTALPGFLAPSKNTYDLPDRDLLKDNLFPVQAVVSISTNYFDTMNVRLIRGRHFNALDVRDNLPVVIIDQLFADKMWPDESAVGKRILLNPDDPAISSWLTVVGITPHIIQAPAFMGRKAETSFYRPLLQSSPAKIQLAVKVDGDVNRYTQAIRIAATGIDRDIPLTDIYSLNEWKKLALGPIEMVSSIFGAVSFVALILASTGIYGLVSRGVLLRTQEMGIRRALGLSNIGTIRLFLHQGGIHLLVGLLIGGTGALLICRGAATLYPEILDVMYFILFGVAALMTFLLLGASWLPARKIVALEPADALHYE